MKPSFEKISYSTEESIHAKHLNMKHFDAPWHFHPEYEIVLITKSFGKRYVGDNIETFKAGDLIFLSPNLPHVWINDKVFYDAESKEDAQGVVIHFAEHYFSKELLNLPEFNFINKILRESNHGLKFTGKEAKEISSLITQMPSLKGISSYTSLLHILELMGKSKSIQTLAGKGYVNTLDLKVPERLSKVIKHITNNYKEKISIEDVAEISSMNKTAFCRYFKDKTGKTFVKYLNEIRISYACKLLIDGKFNVSQACFECGFNNLSNFNRQFKSIIGKTPVEYLENWKG